MKRPFVVAIIIGFLVAGTIGALHATQLLARVELPAREFISLHGTFNNVLSERWQYIFLSILSVGVAWMTLTTPRRGRLGWLVLALVMEVIGFAWVCSLYHVFFQPAPSIFAVVLAFVVSERFFAIYSHSRSRVARLLLGDRLSKEQIQRVVAGDIPFEI